VSKKRTILPLLAGVVFGIALFGATVSNASYCFGYCPFRPGLVYEGCTMYIDESDNIVAVECAYSRAPRDIAE
jgi:hypothetical protein